MNYYQAVEKKPEHGGGWAYMQINRREGVRIYCGCALREDVWTAKLHDTAEEAERCFYDYEVAKGTAWHTYETAEKCVVCDTWTPDAIQPRSHYLHGDEFICRRHFASDEDADRWFWARHPFEPGLKIVASW